MNILRNNRNFEIVIHCIFGTVINTGCVLADDWEIPFGDISEMKWVASGAQGAVFKGKLNREIVAVKKVKEPKETDIRHLKKLNHPNIVQFK